MTRRVGYIPGEPLTVAAASAAITAAARERCGQRHNLSHPAEYVTVASGTTHLREPNARRAICGQHINLDGQKLPTYSTTDTLTCTRCQDKTQRGLKRLHAGKRAK